MIDTHTHLNFPELEDQLPAVLQRAREHGVDAFIVPATDLATSLSSVKLAHEYSNIYSCIGIHPCSAQEYHGVTKDAFLKLFSDETSLTSIGEVGLDYYHFETLTTPSEIEEVKHIQQNVFTEMVELAKRSALPLIIHSREAYEDTKQILGMYPGQKAVIHCFTGTLEQAKGWLEQGCLLSLTGIITYKKNSTLRDVIQSIPLESIMLETDSPYLSPEGFRKNICEPMYIKNVAECIAEIKNLSLEEVDRVTTATAREFFKI